MARQQTVLHALRFDLALIGLILMVAAGYAVLQHPTHRPAEYAAEPGSRPPDRAEGDILLLLPDSPAAEATNFDELDCSYGWFNSLWQEFGSFATALSRDLSPEILAGRSVVIVPVRVAKSLPQNGIEALGDFVRRGGQLVVEQPPNTWGTITGVATSSKTGRAQRISSAEGLKVQGPMRKHLPNVPLTGKLLPAPPMDPYPAGPVLLEVDGQPGLTINPVGQGYVYTLLFNFACTITALQQGLPAQDMRFDKSDGLVPTSRRVADESLLQTEVPYADLLERALFMRLSEVRPLPRLWLFPDVHSGALMMTHPAADTVRAALGYADSGRKRGGVSTLYVPPDRLNRSQAVIAEEAAAEIGLLWVRGDTRPPVADSIGVGAIRPFEQELSLHEQYLRLNATLPQQRPLRLVRTESSLWTNDWATTFKRMAAARLRLDNSFGPAEPEQYGYVFGTGLPYYPVDERGLPLPLLELPYVLHSSGISRARLKSFLENSHAFFNQSIVVSLPSDAMRHDPAPGILMAFRDAHILARENDHWVTTVGEFLDFSSARRRSILTSQWSRDSRRLTISVNLLGSRSATIADGAFPGIAFPRTFDGQEVERVVVDEEEVSLKSIATTGSGYDKILTVAPGRHTISIYYAAAPEPAPIEASP